MSNPNDPMNNERGSTVETPQREAASPFMRADDGLTATDTISDDLSSEATLLHQDLSLAELTVLNSSSVEANKKYPLIEKLTTFGRERDNSIAFPDLSVSRHHFQIHKDNGKFSLEDMSSAGTFVNGKKCHQKTVPLKHGDRIQVGKSLLQFGIIGKPLPEATSSSPVMMIISIIVLLIVLGAGYVIYRQIGKSSEKKKQQLQAQKLYASALQEYQKSHWKQTMNNCQQALQFFPTNQMYLQCVNIARSALKAQQLYRKAKMLNQRGKKHKKEALMVLKQVEMLMPPGSSFADKVWQLRFDVEDSLNKMSNIPPPLPRKYKRRRMRCRYEKINTRRVCVYTIKKDGKTWRYFKKRIKRRRREVFISWQDKYQSNWLFYFDNNHKRIDVFNPAPVVSAKNHGLMLFRRRKIKEAIAFYLKRNNRNQALRLRRFSHYYYSGRQKYNARRVQEAIDALIEAYSLNMEISQGKSSFSSELRRMLANMFFSKGLLAMAKTNYTQAFRQFQTALRYLSSHKASKTKLKELHVISLKWYNDAKKILSKSPTDREAKTLLRKASHIVLPSDTLHKNILKLLDQQ